MRIIDLASVPLWGNLTVFAAAAVVVWMAGTRLAKFVDEIGDRTGLGHAFLGLALLGVATSLPELATTVTASILGNPQMVTGNLFGGVALQIAVLALVDVIAVRGALTYITATPAILFQGVMLILLLSIALAGVASGEPLSFFGIGLTPLLLTAGYAAVLHVTGSGKYLPRWRPAGGPEAPRQEAPEADGGRTGSTRYLYAWCVAAAAVILMAGWMLTLSGEVLAEQTGLGNSFVGVALVAASTSLPELSTTLAAIRQGNHEMAVSNILGTNCLEMALFLVADLAYRGGPILATTDASGMLAASMGLIVTCLMLLGLLERRDQTVARMGLDSFAVLITYIAGLAALYHLR